MESTSNPIVEFITSSEHAGEATRKIALAIASMVRDEELESLDNDLRNLDLEATNSRDARIAGQAVLAEKARRRQMSVHWGERAIQNLVGAVTGKFEFDVIEDLYYKVFGHHSSEWEYRQADGSGYEEYLGSRRENAIEYETQSILRKMQPGLYEDYRIAWHALSPDATYRHWVGFAASVTGQDYIQVKNFGSHHAVWGGANDPRRATNEAYYQGNKLKVEIKWYRHDYDRGGWETHCYIHFPPKEACEEAYSAWKQHVEENYAAARAQAAEALSA